MDNINIEAISVQPSDIVVATYEFLKLSAFQQQNAYNAIVRVFQNNKVVFIPDTIGIEVMTKDRLKALIDSLQDCYNEKSPNKS